MQAIMRVYAVFDRLAEECGPLFEQKNDQVALRAYRNMLKQQSSAPEEFQLLWIGTMDHDKCRFVANDIPVEIVNGKEVPNA